jgi:hypothetical protein
VSIRDYNIVKKAFLSGGDRSLEEERAEDSTKEGTTNRRLQGSASTASGFGAKIKLTNVQST